jgi:hypothetical protein
MNYVIVGLLIVLAAYFNERFNRMEEKMNEETRQIIARVNDATNKVAAKIQALIDTAAQQGTVTEAEIRAALEPTVAQLEALGADPADPVPDPEVVASRRRR